MKNIILSTLMILSLSVAKSQDFKQNLASAKTDYSAGKLAEARFTMQQMLQQIDEKAGQEVLKIYPVSLANFKASSPGEVNGSGLGVMINRSYQSENKTIELGTITNSPLIESLNAILKASAYMSDPNQKVVKVSGYKAMLQKSVSDNGGNHFQLQIPLGNILITLEGGNGVLENELIAAASQLPLANIEALLK